MKFILILGTLLSAAVADAGQLLVSGSCHKEVTPDRVSLTFTSRALEKDPRTASNKATAQYEKIRAEVKKLNLKDIQLSTSGFTVNQEWDYNNNKRTLRGYSAAVSLSVETSEVARAGEVLDLGAKHNLEEISSPNTYLSTALAKREHENCLEAAIKSAKDKAEKMAKAAGHSLGKLALLSELKEPDQQTPRPQHHTRQMDMASEKESISFETKRENVEVVVYATYDLK